MISKNIRTKKTKPNKTKHSKKKNKNLKGGTKKRSNKLKRQNNKVIKGGKKYKLSKLQKGGGLSRKSIQILTENSIYKRTLNFIERIIQKFLIKDRLRPKLYELISELIIEYNYEHETFDYEIITPKIEKRIKTFHNAYLINKERRLKLNKSNHNNHNNHNEVTLNPFLNHGIVGDPLYVPLKQQSKNIKFYNQSNVQQYPKPIYDTIKDVEKLNGISNPFYATTHKVDSQYAEIDPIYATVDEIEPGYATVDEIEPGYATVDPGYANSQEQQYAVVERGSTVGDPIYSTLFNTPTTVERGSPTVEPNYSKLKTSTAKLTSDITAKPK